MPSLLGMMQSKLSSLSRTILVCMLAGGCAAATRKPWPAPPLNSVLEDEHREEHEAHEGHKKGTQVATLFLGGSGEVGNSDGFALGAEYAYHVNDRWAYGAFADGVSGLDRSFAAGLQAYWHATHALVLVAGPGLELHHDEWRPIARLGATYEFPMGKGWALAPAVFYDITEGENLWIYGLNISSAW
jgi:hypothetical protein